MGYSGKAIKGVGWTGFLQIILKGSSLIKFIIIAKFLTPLEFGIFGIALLTIGFFQAMTETGISAYLVQTDKDEEEYVSSAWLVSIARGLILFLLTLVVAYPVSIFFNTKTAFLVIAIAGFIPLINGLENPSIAKFQRYLDFHKEFIFRFSISMFDVLVSASLIIIYKSSLALVTALVFSTLFETILSFIIIKPRPRFVYDIQKIKQLFHFGKWLTFISGLNYFVEQMDSIVVGRLLGVGSLGIYELAQKFSLQIMIDGGNVFSKVTFPLFSRIKLDNKRTKRAFYRIMLVVSLIFGITTIVMFVFSKDILSIFAGTKWLGANIPLKIFSLTGFITGAMAIITSLFLAHSRQDITAKILTGRLVILAILIVPASLGFGIIGTSFVSLLSYLLVLPLAVMGLREVFNNHK